MAVQKKTMKHFNIVLSKTSVESGVVSCLTLKLDAIAHGLCNCGAFINKPRVSVP